MDIKIMAIIREIKSLSLVIRVSRITIRTWIREEAFPHKRLGFEYYFDTKEVSEWLKSFPKRAHLAEALEKYNQG
jgi:predicted DNA-binding transcriptional regulator AlpA